MPPPLCLQERFVSPALKAAFELRDHRQAVSPDLWADICADMIEGALVGADAAQEAALEAEFHALLYGVLAGTVTRDERRFRARVLWTAYGGARGGVERAEAMVRARGGVPLNLGYLGDHIDVDRDTSGGIGISTIGGGAKRKRRDGGMETKKVKVETETEGKPSKEDRKRRKEDRRKEKEQVKEEKEKAPDGENDRKKRKKAKTDEADSKAATKGKKKSKDKDKAEKAARRAAKDTKPRKSKRKRHTPDTDTDDGSDSDFVPDPTQGEGSVPPDKSKATKARKAPKTAKAAASPAPSLPLAIEKKRAPPTRHYRPVNDDLLVKLGLLAPQPKVKRKRVKVQAESDAVAVSASGSVAAARPAPRPRARPPPGGGIASSTFAAVLRLVADLPRARGPPRPSRTTTTTSTRPRPPVWAQTRQELCEALPYYRAFQSGMYMSKQVAYGYLLDGFPAPRDVWAAGGRVIISHGGGQSTRTLDTRGDPVSCLLSDHSAKSDRINTLMRASAARAPVVLLAGAEYALLPWTLGCTYAVLGWYWVSAVWFEAAPCDPASGANGFFRRLKVRFDWVESQGMPWWEVPGEAKATATANAGPQPAASDATSRPPDPLPPPPTASSSEKPPPDALPLAQVAPPSPASSASSPLSSAPPSPLPTPKHHPARPFLPTPPDSEADITLPPPAEQLVQLQLWAGGSVSNHYVDLEAQRPNDGAYESPLRGMYRPGEHTLASAHPFLDTHATELLFAGATCPTCKAHSPRLYAEGWICVQPACAQFWMLSTPRGLFPIPLGMALTFDPAFLEPAPTPPHRRSVPFSVVPPAPSGAETGESDDAQSGSRTLWKGWVCNACGRANCRYRWERWECRACGNRLSDAGAIVPSSGLPPRLDILGEADDCSPGVVMSVRRLSSPPATVVAYRLARAGTVYHILHDTSNVADAIWEAYQRAAVDVPGPPLFERRELKSNTVKGGLLSQQFAINSGASYKYIVETLSYTFAESPPSVMDALQLIRERVASVLGERVDFNEILSVMYREGQKMNWHDDSEPGLGPVVAALSLGSPATMSFRRKTARNKSAAASASAATSSKEQLRRPLPVLNFALSHGDVVIMAGRAIQHMYDHKVVPLGLRVAATARVIQG